MQKQALALVFRSVLSYLLASALEHTCFGGGAGKRPLHKTISRVPVSLVGPWFKNYRQALTGICSQQIPLAGKPQSCQVLSGRSRPDCSLTLRHLQSLGPSDTRYFNYGALLDVINIAVFDALSTQAAEMAGA